MRALLCSSVAAAILAAVGSFVYPGRVFRSIDNMIHPARRDHGGQLGVLITYDKNSNQFDLVSHSSDEVIAGVARKRLPSSDLFIKNSDLYVYSIVYMDDYRDRWAYWVNSGVAISSGLSAVLNLGEDDMYELIATGRVSVDTPYLGSYVIELSIVMLVVSPCCILGIKLLKGGGRAR